MHAVMDRSELSASVIDLTFICPYGRSAAESIYLLDQQLARFQIRYALEPVTMRPQAIFVVGVPVEHSARVESIIAQLQRW
jgi:hypothetical protein